MSKIKSIKRKTHAMKLIELQWGDSIEKILHFLYVEEDMSIRDVADEIGITKETAYKWLLMCDIKMKIKYEKMLGIASLRRRLKCNQE